MTRPTLTTCAVNADPFYSRLNRPINRTRENINEAMADSLKGASNLQRRKGNATAARDSTDGSVIPSRNGALKDSGDRRAKVIQRKSEEEDARDGTYGVTSAVVQTTIPAWLNIGIMMSLIFGGCCSNVSCDC